MTSSTSPFSKFRIAGSRSEYEYSATANCVEGVGREKSSRGDAADCLLLVEVMDVLELWEAQVALCVNRTD